MIDPSTPLEIEKVSIAEIEPLPETHLVATRRKSRTLTQERDRLQKEKELLERKLSDILQHQRHQTHRDYFAFVILSATSAVWLWHDPGTATSTIGSFLLGYLFGQAKPTRGDSSHV